MIFDAHLDLSYNALRGRDVLRPALEQKPDEDGIPTVGLPDLIVGGVGMICATIFCEPASGQKAGYHNSDEAHAEALRHLGWYHGLERDGSMNFIRRAADLENISTSKPNAIMLLEGGDALRGPEDAAEFFAAGVRLVGLAWKRTRYAGGTGQPGPLTAEGVEMVSIFDQLGIIHDLSHLAEAAFFQLLDISSAPVMASHSNCRAIVPTDRQLSDQMIRALAGRGGVIGINFYDKFLLPPDQQGKRRATLADVVAHIRHICDLLGDADHVGLGTDMDGGLGAEQIPLEIRTSADLPRVRETLATSGISPIDAEKIMFGNWMRFFQKSLPRG